ncbi:MAG: peptidase [Ferruginibacter sp.]|uniref:M13-type metalloendopeptidase n=1 Tax=Ferruginibacter sp. TaxID=1940288 RepID=UPI002657BDD2|nr:M13-type metalloendopeptidase [Ferruginibacter sp.]MDB5279076.1 peptidase [Ferruginibacter sp.]
MQQVVDLYNSFTVLDTLHVKGALTLGENTADAGGVAIAYDAFKLTQQGHTIDGITPGQRLFISTARIWRVKMKDAYLRYWINNNPHSPPMWRVNGPLMNLPYFYQAFHIQAGDRMYLGEKQRVKIWQGERIAVCNFTFFYSESQPRNCLREFLYELLKSSTSSSCKTRRLTGVHIFTSVLCRQLDGFFPYRSAIYAGYPN